MIQIDTKTLQTLQKDYTIIGPTEASRNELEKAVSKALNGMPVNLADDALTKDDRHIIERKQHVDA